MSIPYFLVFEDLKKRRIVNSRPQLKHMVENQGFPPGRLISAHTRAWTEEEILTYIETRPVGPLQLARGAGITEEARAKGRANREARKAMKAGA